MIDILTTRFHDAYSYLVTENGNLLKDNNNKHITATPIKRRNEEYLKQQKIQNATVITTQLKDAEEETNTGNDSTDSASILALDGLICQDCSKNLNRESQLHPSHREQAAVDILKVTQHASTNNKYDWGTYFPYLAQCKRMRKYDYKLIFDQVLNHKRVQYEIERVAKDAVRESDVPFELEDFYLEQMISKYKRKAYKALLAMRCTLSDKLLRITSYVLYKLLPWFLSGVVAHPAQVEMLKMAGKKMPNTPLIYLPVHRSHLDYILITFILCNYDLQAPQVIAGDNLNIPVFGYLLRGLGAIYIKRKIDGADGKKDYVYRGLLQTYLQESIIAGHNIEFFIEGGRTRTGKPSIPKGGILSVIVDAYIEGLIGDALLVPVSVNYEKLVDGNFIREQLGTPKRKESFRKAVASIWKILNAKYGEMRIDFNEPFSLKELVNSFKERRSSVPRPIPTTRRLMSRQSINSTYGIETIDKHRVLVDNIARHVVYDSSAAMSIMSTNALAYLLLNKHRKGATMKELSQSLKVFREQMATTQRDFGFDGSDQKVIIRAVELLGDDMIESRVLPNGETFIAPILNVPNVVETFYYSNTLLPHISLDAAVVNAIGASINENCPYLTISDVVDVTMLYCDVLRYEFIFSKPCQDMTDMIEQTVRRLCTLGIIVNSNEEFALNLKLSETLLSTMAAFNITYWSTAECLRTLHEKIQMLESDFIKLCLQHMIKKFNDGVITYGEAISTDSIKNCLKLLEKWAVIEVDSQSGVRIMSLNSLYSSSSGIANVIDKIERFVVVK